MHQHLFQRTKGGMGKNYGVIMMMVKITIVSEDHRDLKNQVTTKISKNVRSFYVKMVKNTSTMNVYGAQVQLRKNG